MLRQKKLLQPLLGTPEGIYRGCTISFSTSTASAVYPTAHSSIINCSDPLDLTILSIPYFIIHCFDHLDLPILTEITFSMICPVWSQSSCHSISAFLKLVFQSRLVSIGSFLNRRYSQSEIFSIGSFLNRIFSQLDLFSIGSFLNWIFLGSPPYAIFQHPKNREM